MGVGVVSLETPGPRGLLALALILARTPALALALALILARTPALALALALMILALALALALMILALALALALALMILALALALALALMILARTLALILVPAVVSVLAPVSDLASGPAPVLVLVLALILVSVLVLDGPGGGLACGSERLVVAGQGPERGVERIVRLGRSGGGGGCGVVPAHVGSGAAVARGVTGAQPLGGLGLLLRQFPGRPRAVHGVDGGAEQRRGGRLVLRVRQPPRVLRVRRSGGHLDGAGLGADGDAVVLRVLDRVEPRQLFLERFLSIVSCHRVPPRVGLKGQQITLHINVTGSRGAGQPTTSLPGYRGRHASH
ncbi:hypothetical protein [Nonomuraea pusilla]|uniref:hypothetical protein n=1 Tax=Nonomuraea pusilla TaxID=46177 RepID=UPI000AF8662D|nr:hypothetical protein [Nonomuraea pusilla]